MAIRRVERLQKEILRELSAILLHKLNDPRIGLLTLTRVELSGDLKIAKVFCTVLGGDAAWRRTLAGLKHGRGWIQKELGERLSVRSVPEVVFQHDVAAAKAYRVNELLGGLERERSEREGADKADPEEE